MNSRYFHSELMLERALRTIPLGSQTFSKSKVHYPFGVSPYFIKNGNGSRVWDIDGNEYIDFINSLAAVTLGYNDQDVGNAVRVQLSEGVIFSLPHPLEVEVSEKIVDMVPCAEMVRFGKNGSDATSGAIRLARAYKNRDRVAVCGYHGWQDWFIGSTTRNRGVPKATQELTHTFIYNDLNSLNNLFQKYPGEIAAVILEPMNIIKPENDFLQKVKELTHKNGALLIFDETVTGFRFANGGAQEYFGVTPDLATFGKGMANGYPISAVVGKKEIMTLMNEIFYSFTFGGETLSLAASLATLSKLQNEPVIETIINQGEVVLNGIRELIKKHNIDHILSISGHPAWSFLSFKDVNNTSQWEIKTLFLQEVFARGILTLGTHNISYSHSKSDINQLLSTYDEVFAILKKAVHESKVDKYLKCQPLTPLFKIR
ncbi:aminotransferase class III-fold pyridoxal phosphate-dependent enzyme [Metabacillus bambusae]|uniref:Aminotransferase class III-fold pyridoxal phosphate-dependent enzyme n=1 Tax=Metabacillus bambusae TaxID=2795218 RepID=A0ABS3N5P5_9BACI|nr:aminotransferase class III-fold pyridoxal phosphate-dependent enzyme [Metabacillus bambusae]MBO1513355.1 aminotransferase class III-fold pyridoxal phosphate-dependent enzyme [Metabacillus bambusae]